MTTSDLIIDLWLHVFLVCQRSLTRQVIRVINTRLRETCIKTWNVRENRE
jgi:hypothetical protein